MRKLLITIRDGVLFPSLICPCIYGKYRLDEGKNSTRCWCRRVKLVNNVDSQESNSNIACVVQVKEKGLPLEEMLLDIPCF
jgi:hypothetical protein